MRLRGPLWALARKEMLMIRRDLREWMEALYMLVVRVGGIAHLFYWIAYLVYAALLAAGVFLVSAGAWTGWRFWLRMLGLVWLLAVAAAAVIVPVVFGGMDIDRREASLR